MRHTCLAALLSQLLVLGTALAGLRSAATDGDQQRAPAASPHFSSPFVARRPLHSFADRLVAAALERLKHFVIYDGSYKKIDYPMGDVSPFRGVCTDVVIRSYRRVGIDLQKEVHLDMRANFEPYPKHWGLKKPDTNIDHRRVPNLRVFFARHGKQLPVTNDPADYRPGGLARISYHRSSRDGARVRPGWLSRPRCAQA